MPGTPVTPAIGVTSRYSGRVAQNRRIFPSCGYATAMFGRSVDRAHGPRGRRGPAGPGSVGGPWRHLRVGRFLPEPVVSPGTGGFFRGRCFPGPGVPACRRARYVLPLTASRSPLARLTADRRGRPAPTARRAQSGRRARHGRPTAPRPAHGRGGSGGRASRCPAGLVPADAPAGTGPAEVRRVGMPCRGRPGVGKPGGTETARRPAAFSRPNSARRRHSCWGIADLRRSVWPRTGGRRLPSGPLHWTGWAA